MTGRRPTGPATRATGRHADSTSSPVPSATRAPPSPARSLHEGRQVRTITGHPGRAPQGRRSRSARSTSTIRSAWWRRSTERRRSTTPTGCASPIARRPRAGRRQLEGALPRRQAGRRAADRPREHHAPEQRLAAALLPWQGAGGAGAGRVRRLVRRSCGRPSSSAATACCSTTSPGSCAGCPSSPSAAAATTGSGASTSTTWRSSAWPRRPRRTTVSPTPSGRSAPPSPNSSRHQGRRRQPGPPRPCAGRHGPAAARVLGLALRDVLLTADEYRAMAAGLADTDGPATGSTALSAWLAEHGGSSASATPTSSSRHFDATP